MAILKEAKPIRLRIEVNKEGVFVIGAQGVDTGTYWTNTHDRVTIKKICQFMGMEVPK